MTKIQKNTTKNKIQHFLMHLKKIQHLLLIPTRKNNEASTDDVVQQDDE